MAASGRTESADLEPDPVQAAEASVQAVARRADYSAVARMLYRVRLDDGGAPHCLDPGPVEPERSP